MNNPSDLIEREDFHLIKDGLHDKILWIRGTYVILDSDLAILYNVETKVLNQAMKRNIKRFPENFCFLLTNEEYRNLRSHFVTSRWGGRRSNPYAFTEQGVAMLSAVLKSETAIDVSIKVIEAFVQMRRFITANAQVLFRLDNLENRQTFTEKRLDDVFSAIEDKTIKPQNGIFFNGQIFDAHAFISNLIRSALKKIIIIDNYIDETVLVHLTKKKPFVKVIIYTSKIKNSLLLDVKKFDEQYPTIELHEFSHSHDRFIIIDDKEIYHIGASLMDLGKKWFAFSKIDIDLENILSKLDLKNKIL